MKFCKHVSSETRKKLTKQLTQYEQEVKMNANERQELHTWVAKGNSPYDNEELICVENGYPLDFITAKRLLNQHSIWLEKLSEVEQDTFLSTAIEYDTMIDEPVYRSYVFEHLPDDEANDDEVSDAAPF